MQGQNARASYPGRMATKAEIVIRVRSARGSSTVSYTTKGRYVSFTTSGLTDELLKQPIQPTTSLSAFWLSVLAIVQADINALE
jgi:hypothetical protein